MQRLASTCCSVASRTRRKWQRSVASSDWTARSTGKHLGTLATGVATANLAFGDDGSTLYLTADKNLVRVRTKVKGW